MQRTRMHAASSMPKKKEVTPEIFNTGKSAFVQVYNMGTAYEGWNNRSLRMKEHESLVLLPGAEVKGSISWWLEQTTFAPLWLPVVFWMPVVGWFMSKAMQASCMGACCTFLVAFAFGWPISEYLLHRYILHFPVGWGNGNGVVNLFQFMAHGIHHAHPRDRLRLVTPLPFSLVVAVVLLPLFFWILKPVDAYAWVSGYITGYVFYDLVHYYVHFGSPGSLPSWMEPIPTWLRRLKKNHAHHHYATDGHTNTFGVSHSLWDEIFHTQTPSSSSGSKEGKIQ